MTTKIDCHISPLGTQPGKATATDTQEKRGFMHQPHRVQHPINIIYNINNININVTINVLILMLININVILMLININVILMF